MGSSHGIGVVRVAAAALVLSALASAQVHPAPQPHRAGTPRIPQKAVAAGLVTSDMGTGGQTAASLVQALVGTGVNISNITFNGAPVAAGTFSGGIGIIGFAQGIILSSGDIASVVGPDNLSPSTSTDNGLNGDADLDALVGGATLDACVLEFDFECPTTNSIAFQYVFSSEEYDEWVDTQYNDVFAFFLNGQNIALIPNTTTPVAINNVNCGNPWAPGGGINCGQYHTNACDSLGLPYPCTAVATEMDGLTEVFTATGALQSGLNHIKLAVADRGDRVYDTNVFIRGQSFSCGGGSEPAFDPPSPCGQTLHVAPGTSFFFEVDALATNGEPNETVTLSVTGDTIPLAGGIFVPPMPVGPAPEVTTEFEWTPGAGDVGLWHLLFTATDQLGQTATCDVAIDVTPVLATWTNLGFAKDGTNGTPELTGSGTLAGSSANSVDLANAVASSTVTLVFGLTQINAPFKGGVMVPQPFLLIPMTADTNGETSLPFTFPSGIPAGLALYFQFWNHDTGATFNLSASNGLRGVTP